MLEVGFLSSLEFSFVLFFCSIFCVSCVLVFLCVFICCLFALSKVVLIVGVLLFFTMIGYTVFV